MVRIIDDAIGTATLGVVNIFQQCNPAMKTIVSPIEKLSKLCQGCWATIRILLAIEEGNEAWNKLLDLENDKSNDNSKTLAIVSLLQNKTTELHLGQ